MKKYLKPALLLFSILALLGPNGIYLYYSFFHPELNSAAVKNPIALAFMVEAMMLLGLFLFYVYRKTKSWPQVWLYLVLSFVGSLAFSFPFFLYRNFERLGFNNMTNKSYGASE